MVENVLNEIKSLGDELEATKEKLESTREQLIEAKEEIMMLKSEAVDIDLLHSRILHLQRENEELRLSNMNFQSEGSIAYLDQIHNEGAYKTPSLKLKNI